jgi:hypothetical protein
MRSRGPRLLVAPALAAAALAWAAAPRAQESRSQSDDTPLMKEMEKLDAAMEFLKRSVRDPAQDEQSLEQVVLAQQASLASKQMMPRMAAHVPEPERAKFAAEYRKAMATTLAELAHLEVALLEGDRDKARSLWKKLDSMKDEGHNTFTEGE